MTCTLKGVFLAWKVGKLGKFWKVLLSLAHPDVAVMVDWA